MEESERTLDHFRAFERKPVTLSATVTRSDGLQHVARVIDLGLGGACLELPDPILDGASVSVAVEAPELWDPLALEATVVWSQPVEGAARLGVEFKHRSGRTLRTLTELLDTDRTG